MVFCSGLKKKYKFVLSENSEDIIIEFKTMCNEISNISGTKIDAEYYIKRY